MRAAVSTLGVLVLNCASVSLLALLTMQVQLRSPERVGLQGQLRGLEEQQHGLQL